MSLDVSLYAVRRTELFDANITHNLGRMASEAGIYDACWQPEGIGAFHAGDIIKILENGIADMKARPDYYRQFEPENKWGTYDGFLPWLEKYLAACLENPDAEIVVSR